jgi:hypothetical protein
MTDSVGNRFTNIVLALVVVSAILIFAVSFQQQNTAPFESSITSSPHFSKLNSTINNLIENKTYTKGINASVNEQSEISFGWVIWHGIIAFGQLIISLPLALFTSFGALGSSLLGIPSVYINIIGVAVTVSLVILLVRFFRQGQ